jgi:hypothetical protein
MMHVLPCARVRDDLMAYHDGELPIEIQVLIQNHLQDCVACRLEAAALADLSHALHDMAGEVHGRCLETGRITGAVLERIRVERQFSLSARVYGLFEDMHLVWAGLGASLAMIFCVFASAGVLHAASQERSDSLAGIISTLANAGTHDTVRLAEATNETNALLDTTAAIPASGATTDLMLSAVVTREGRIQNVEVLEDELRALPIKPEVVLAMIDAASRARFERAPSRSQPPAVNVVWLVTATIVKGRPDYDLYLLSPPPWTPAAGAANLPSPRKRPRAPKAPETGGSDGLAAA